jgi:hypothetical protein
MENTAYRNAMELLARRRSQAEKDAACGGRSFTGACRSCGNTMAKPPRCAAR